ncbi:Hypothetical protein POVN_LOCUS267 [uncultured virus]|nr:Hypothetical protein POVN_LOCUS267 [uncultured virus]
MALLALIDLGKRLEALMESKDPDEAANLLQWGEKGGLASLNTNFLAALRDYAATHEYMGALTIPLRAPAKAPARVPVQVPVTAPVETSKIYTFSILGQDGSGAGMWFREVLVVKSSDTFGSFLAALRKSNVYYAKLRQITVNQRKIDPYTNMFTFLAKLKDPQLMVT